MEIISINDTKKVTNPENVFVEFVLDAQNLSKILINILYFKEKGFRKFVLTYNFNNFKFPMTKVAEKISDGIFNLIETQDIVIALKGFPRCIFERNLLRPGLCFKYDKKLLFLENDLNEDKEFVFKCNRCMMKENCRGINKEYLQSFKDEEFDAMISNYSLSELNFKNIERFENIEVKKNALKILDDFKEDKSYMRKRIVYVRSYPDDLVESSKERIVYYIYNHYSDFEKTYDFILSFFENENDLIEPFKVFLESSEQFALSFAKMGDFGIRKSFYFDISHLSLEQIETLSEMIGVEIKNNYIILGFDFKNEEISYKVYYSNKTVTSKEIKDFISEINFENKKLLMRFSNSLTKPVNQVFFDYKYKDFNLYSKRVDISMQYNGFRLNPLAILFGLNLKFFDDKDVYTLSFEVSEFQKEKINFYYALKLQPEIEEELQSFRVPE